jgi:hypothetical protein
MKGAGAVSGERTRKGIFLARFEPLGEKASEEFNN